MTASARREVALHDGAEGAPLVDIRGLCKHYTVGRDGLLFGSPIVVRAVDNVTLSIRPGENLGLVGESGCGKSTLGRTMLRLLEPTSGDVRICGTDIRTLSRSDLRRFRRNVQMVFQDPFGSLNPRLNVHELLAEPLRVHALVPGPSRGAAEVEAVERLLDQVGLPPDSRSRYPHEFSGGQRQRIGIARALAVKPRLIVADEPVSALDVSIQAQIVNLLHDLQAREQLTYLFISHDLKVVEHLCDSVAVMYLGRVVEWADTDALYGAPRHPYTAALIASVVEPPHIAEPGSPLSGPPKRRETPSQAERRRLFLFGDAPSATSPPPGCPFHPRCPKYAEQGKPEVCRRDQPQLRPLSSRRPEAPQTAAATRPHQVACHFAE